MKLVTNKQAATMLELIAGNISLSQNNYVALRKGTYDLRVDYVKYIQKSSINIMVPGS